MDFLALAKKKTKQKGLSISASGSFKVMFTLQNTPDHAIETRTDARNSFFENETTFVYIKKKLRNFHNAPSLQENVACSAANPSVHTIVAILWFLFCFLLNFRSRG